jgi:DNA-binding transcriptional regulator YiaG
MRPGVSKPGDWRAGFHLSGCGEKFQSWKFRKTLRKSARGKWDACVYKLMQGRKDQKDGNETRKTGELDGWALVDDLRTFVEETELSLPKIANLIGVFSATLSMWVAGTSKPSRTQLLAIKGFLKRRYS